MKTSLKIILFVLGNSLGFWAASLVLVSVAASGLIDLRNVAIPGGLSFADWFIPRVMFCWLICGLFSIAGFFLRGTWQIAFLMAPAIVPLVFGAGLLLTL